MRRLDGWTPTATTEYEYDDAGRLVRSTTTTEPEWDETQEGWLLALAEWRAARCPCGCGLDRRESLAAENEDRYKTTVVRCHARAAMVTAADRYKDEPNAESLLFGVEL